MQYASGWGPPPNESLGSCVFLQIGVMGLPKGYKGHRADEENYGEEPALGYLVLPGGLEPPTHLLRYRPPGKRTGRVHEEKNGPRTTRNNWLAGRNEEFPIFALFTTFWFSRHPESLRILANRNVANSNVLLWYDGAQEAWDGRRCRSPDVSLLSIADSAVIVPPK